MSEIALAPYGDGRFEVFVDEKKLYSKLDTGDFPDASTLAAKIKKML